MLSDPVTPTVARLKVRGINFLFNFVDRVIATLGPETEIRDDSSPVLPY